MLRKEQTVHVPAEIVTGVGAASKAGSSAAAATDGYDAQLFTRLRILRRSLADELHIPAYVTSSGTAR